MHYRFKEALKAAVDVVNAQVEAERAAKVFDSIGKVEQ